MPFKSQRQRKFMHAQHPAMAARWEREAKAAGTKPVQPSKKAKPPVAARKR